MLDRIYPILDRHTFERFQKSPEDLIRSWDALGIHTFQIRDKQASESEYLAFARDIKRAFPASQLIANDFRGLALENQDIFHALHLGQEDWMGLRESEREELVRACARGFRLGLSTHNLRQFQAAAELNLAYVAVGPVNPTTSKPTGTDPVISAAELDSILEEAGRLGRQVVLIGGINASNLQKILSPKRRHWFTERPVPVPAVIQAALDPDELRAMLRLLNPEGNH